MKKNFLIIIGLLVAALALQAQAGTLQIMTNLNGRIGLIGSSPTTNSSSGNNGRNSSTTVRTSADARFLAQAAEDALHEIALGNLAEVNSSNPGVQAFGATLVQDATASYQQAVSVASANGISIPSAENVQDANEDIALGRLTGSQFDVAFLNEIVKDRSKDIPLFETEAQRGQIADVRAFAQAQFPVVATHLSIAFTLQDSLGLLPPRTLKI